jgi:hypothetical protein
MKDSAFQPFRRAPPDGFSCDAIAKSMFYLYLLEANRSSFLRQLRGFIRMRQLANFKRHALLAASSVLSACSGSSGSSSVATPTPNLETAEGLWSGMTGTNRSVAGLVLDDGTFWFIYTAVGNNAVVAGAVQGQGTSSNGKYSAANGVDFNLEGLGLRTFKLSGTYAARSKFGGTLTYTGGSTDIFSSTYISDYDLTPSLATIAGTYSGTAASGAGLEAVTVSISGSGAITGMDAGGCRFAGTAALHSKGNVYDVSVTFGGGHCSNGTSVVTGVAYYDVAKHELVSAGLNSGRTNGYLFAGIKP